MKPFPHILYFALLLLTCYSCGGNERAAAGAESDAVVSEEESAAHYDTLLSCYGQSYVDSIPRSFDTTFLIDGTPHTLYIHLELNGKDTVSYDETYVKDSVVNVYRYSGRDISYVFQLFDSQDNQLWKKTLTKRTYMKELGSIVAQSNMHLPEFKTFFGPTRQIILTQIFAVPDSDVGVEGSLYFETNGDYQINYHRWYGSSGSDCEVAYAKDSSCLLTCSEIITAGGKHVSIDRPKATIAGTRFIGSSHIFVAYGYMSGSKELGGRLYSTSGKLVKEFDYQGYSGGLSYEIPMAHLDKFGNYYFVDTPNKCFHVINEENPAAVRKVPFSTIRFVPEQRAHDTIIEMYTEMTEHKLAVNSKGEVCAHQMRLFGDDWVFDNDIEY